MVTDKKHDNWDCDKAHCPETDSYLTYELKKLYPGLKAELDNWYKENGSAICEKHWKELKKLMKSLGIEKQSSEEWDKNHTDGYKNKSFFSRNKFWIIPIIVAVPAILITILIVKIRKKKFRKK